jgi:hypothetical protein
MEEQGKLKKKYRISPPVGLISAPTRHYLLLHFHLLFPSPLLLLLCFDSFCVAEIALFLPVAVVVGVLFLLLRSHLAQAEVEAAVIVLVRMLAHVLAVARSAALFVDVSSSQHLKAVAASCLILFVLPRLPSDAESPPLKQAAAASGAAVAAS